MPNRRWLAVGILGFAGTLAAAATPGERVLQAVQGACASLQSQRAEREAAAAAAAARFVQGGTLRVAGSIPRFDIEWLGRAGGLMPVIALRSPAEVQPTDVLVYGCLAGAGAADLALLRQVQERQGLTVVLGPAEQAAELRPAASFYLTVDAPVDTPLRAPTLAAATLAGLWAFTGDLVSACTRLGVTPTLWQSVMVPGARERNARYRTQRVHSDLTVPPQASGVLGELYLAGIAAALAGLESQAAQVRAAAALLRAAQAAGRTVFHANLGHFEPVRLLPAGSAIPLAALAGKEPQEDVRQRGVAGDVLLAVWYTDPPVALLEAAQASGLRAACILARNPTVDRATVPVEVLLDPQWVLGDALVELPGYDVRILPPSGVLNTTLFLAIVAEAESAPGD